MNADRTLVTVVWPVKPDNLPCELTLDLATLDYPDVIRIELRKMAEVISNQEGK